jgi:hypothetical protein
MTIFSTVSTDYVLKILYDGPVTYINKSLFTLNITGNGDDHLWIVTDLEGFEKLQFITSSPEGKQWFRRCLLGREPLGSDDPDLFKQFMGGQLFQ